MNRILPSLKNSVIFLCLMLGFAACSKESEPPTTESAERAAASNDVPSTLQDPRANPPAVRSASGPPTAVVVPSDPTAALNALTQAVRKYTFEKRQPPTSLEELTKAGYVQTLPQPPAGKKFVIDRKRMVVELANQ